MIIQSALAANASQYIQNQRNQKTETMSRIRVTYIALDSDGERPIVTAGNFEDLRAGLDEYYGTERFDAECLGFFPYESKYPDAYEGHFKYRATYPSGVEVDQIKVYCVDFFPLTAEK